MGFRFDWSVIGRYSDELAEGFKMTLQMAVSAMAIALVLGLIIALVRLSRFKVLKVLADLYIQTFRGIPLFVFLIWVYYGVAMMSGVNVPSMVAGLICLSMLHSAYLAETYRAGIESVSKGQREAAASVGMKPGQVMRYIVLPQAIRTVLPPIGNEFMVLLKGTTLVGLVGVTELVYQAQLATSLTFRPFEFYTALAVIYILTVTFFSRLVALLERRMKGKA